MLPGGLDRVVVCATFTGLNMVEISEAQQVIGGERRWSLIHGDSAEVLKQFPDNTFDSCVTDAPYGLGKNVDAVSLLRAWLNGGDYDFGKGFMQASWDKVPGPNLWREVFRVLKPGAYCFVFAGSRTVDLMGLALRLAGFELKDTCVWITGQGNPHGLDLSKAFDRAAGVEPKVVGPKKYADGTVGHWSASEIYAQDAHTKGLDGSVKMETEPVTEMAKRWHGWNVSLKPSLEPIILARKPLDGTVIQNVEKWGVGGLHVDACRVPTDWSDRSESWKRSGHSAKPEADKIANPPGIGINCHDLGRYPPNVLFGHSEGCRVVGTKRVKARVINRWQDGAKPFGGGAGHGYEQVQCGEYDEVPIYECEPECAVAELDRQSGFSITPDSVPEPAFGTNSAGIYNTKTGTGRSGRVCKCQGDSGTASRFYPCFQYEAKANRTDRNTGLDERCSHTTVKPRDLERWRCRLVTPQGGLILDPFAGVASTGQAAALEGFRWVGIELNDTDKMPFVTQDRQRLQHVLDERPLEEKRETANQKTKPGGQARLF